MKLADFQAIWILDTEYRAPAGELPTVHCLVAREVHSGELVRLSDADLAFAPEPPFDIGPNTLLVGYYLPAEYSCFLQLGWPRPVNSLDLCTEYKWHRSGINDGHPRDLIGTLNHFNLVDYTPTNKDRWREVAMRGSPFEDIEMRGLMDYCQQNVDATAALLRAMEPYLDLPRALLRGRYSWTVAQMEENGTPIDTELLAELRDNWDDIEDGLIVSVDKAHIYVDGSFNEKRRGAVVARNGIAWPKLPSGRLCLDNDTFRQQARAHSIVAPYHELRTSLSKLKLHKLAVGKDGRNRCMLSPFGANTGRHTPSNAAFIFGPATWIRGLIKPQPGTALAYVDWKQQELGIAAALSKDQALMQAYTSGDPYLTFARMAGAVPPNATKKSHPEQRAVYKVSMLAVQYGMGAKALAQQTATLGIQAQKLLQAHRDAFKDFWAWSERVQNTAFATGRLTSRFGWQRRASSMDSPASIRNFPVQANGAEMLRLARMRMIAVGVRVCAPVHDAVLVEVERKHAKEQVEVARTAMRWASEQVLPGFALDTDVKLVTAPNRYMDIERGKAFWNVIMRILGRPLYE
jgi:DNA polymerase I